MRNTVIGVMGSGQDPHPELAAAAGRLIAERGCHLLTGGGAGVMTSVSEAFVRTPERAGLCLGVLKGTVEGARYLALGGPNPFVELAVRTHLPDSGESGTDLTSRNHINVLTADAVVVLPGGPGTQSELELALRYGRPVVVFARPGDRVGALVIRDERLVVSDRDVAVALGPERLAAFLDEQLP
jgi:uncharacterized protein (TIGR00725 family)